MREPFSAIGVLAFSFASYEDGAVWLSGVLAGIGGAWLYVVGTKYLKRAYSRY